MLLISGSARIFWLGDVEADCEHCCERFVGLVDLLTLFVVLWNDGRFIWANKVQSHLIEKGLQRVFRAILGIN